VPGLTAAGLEIATLADVREEINEKWREFFGASMDVSDRSPDGHVIGIVAEVFATLWELLEAVKSARDPNAASGALLRALAALTGTIETPASFSTVTLTLTGTPTTVVAVDSLSSTSSTEQQFRHTEAGTIVAATARATSTAYALGDRRSNSGNIYLVVVAGTSGVGAGPVGDDPDPDVTELDGTELEWRFLGEGTGFVDVEARATAVGPIVALAGDIVGRDTPVGGWDGVVNILDATLGRAAMTDAELRVLRVLELGRPGTSPKGAIRAAALDVTGVTSATVFSNITDVTDADGVPPHSVELLVRGGADQDIWDMLLANVADGIRTHGTEVGTAVDSQGTSHEMKFSRVTEILVYVDVTLVNDPNTYPADGDDQVKAAISTGGNARDDGVNVVSSKLISLIDTVSGVLEIDLPLISADPITVPVATTTIQVSLRERAVFDTTRITVATSNGVP
jgi:hypothetical protein